MRALLLVLALLAGCAHHTGTGGPIDPASVVAQARVSTLPFALQGRYSVRIQRGTLDVSTRGGLVLDRVTPDQGARFRVEVFGPLGTPAFLVASDGTALNVWNQSNATFYRGLDAAAVLQKLTGGAVTLADISRILTGRVPLPNAPLRSSTVDGDAVVLTLDAGQGALVTARVDPRSGLATSLSLQRAEGPPLLSVTYGRPMKVGGERLPSALTLTVVPLDLVATVSFESWDELGQIPEVFALQAPTGAVDKDLVEALTELAAQEGARPPP